MLMIKSINLLILFSLLSASFYASPVLAKPISNTLKSTVNVTSTSGTTENSDELGDIGNSNNEDNPDSTNQAGDDNYIDINGAINATSEGGILKINSGQYKLNFITDKNITIECADENGYVDIITEELHTGMKIKVGERVTINKEGINPVNLLWGLNKTKDGSPAILNGDEIKLNVEQDKEVEIKIRQQIKNKLGFHDLKVILKVNNAENIVVTKIANGTFKIIPLEGEGIFDLGRLPDESIDTVIKLKFTIGGEYIIDLWADDGR